MRSHDKERIFTFAIKGSALQMVKLVEWMDVVGCARVTVEVANTNEIASMCIIDWENCRVAYAVSFD